MQVERTAQALRLTHPADRHGAILKDRMSTGELDASLEAYRQACKAAGEEVRKQLQALSERLTVSFLAKIILTEDFMSVDSTCNRKGRYPASKHFYRWRIMVAI